MSKEGGRRVEDEDDIWCGRLGRWEAGVGREIWDMGMK